MPASLMAIVLVSIVIPASNQGFPDSESAYVGEIFRVTSSSSFECRLSDYKPEPAVRFRIHVLGVDPQNDAVSRKILEERLQTAKRIELRNATYKSYFRIKAELWLDGKPFCETPAKKIVEVEGPTQKRLQYPIVYRPVSTLSNFPETPEAPVKPPLSIKNRSASIGELLKTEIDCSMLTEDTPLSEALDILCESVQPRLPLLIRWDELQNNTFIDKDTPIGVEGFGRLKLRYALNHVLQAAAGREPTPGLIAEGGILILGSQEMLLSHRNTRVYDVKDLLVPPSTGGLYQQGNQSNLGNVVGNLAR